MEILIKGMEMPEAGDHVLLLHVYHDGTASIIGDHRHYKNAPFEVVPVPPHGDLIDRNGIKWIKEEFEERCHNDRWTVVEKIAYKYQVDKLPTIIPASEDEFPET